METSFVVDALASGFTFGVLWHLLVGVIGAGYIYAKGILLDD